jgi:hypothetical protein
MTSSKDAGSPHATTSANEARRLRAPPVGALEIYAVSNEVNSVRNNGPELLEPPALSWSSSSQRSGGSTREQVPNHLLLDCAASWPRTVPSWERDYGACPAAPTRPSR